MKTIAMGEFYVWYCEWCDSRNLTLWSRTMGGKVGCGCCHKEFAVGPRQHEAAAQLHAAHL